MFISRAVIGENILVCSKAHSTCSLQKLTVDNFPDDSPQKANIVLWTMSYMIYAFLHLTFTFDICFHLWQSIIGPIIFANKHTVLPLFILIFVTNLSNLFVIFVKFVLFIHNLDAWMRNNSVQERHWRTVPIHHRRPKGHDRLRQVIILQYTLIYISIFYSRKIYNHNRLVDFLNEKQRDPRLNEILYPHYNDARVLSSSSTSSSSSSSSP